MSLLSCDVTAVVFMTSITEETGGNFSPLSEDREPALDK